MPQLGSRLQPTNRGSSATPAADEPIEHPSGIAVIPSENALLFPVRTDLHNPKG